MTQPEPVDYDRVAEIYDLWVKSRQAELHRVSAFYLGYVLQADGPCVELGVGDGRLLIAAARNGKAVIGVDSSGGMLAVAQRHSIGAGVADRVEFIQADFRQFQLPKPAALIVMPYDSIGHLVSSSEKLEALRTVYGQLRPGGKFMLDLELFDRAGVEKVERKMYLQYVDEDLSGPTRMLWLSSIVDWPNRAKRVHIWLDLVGPDGSVTRRWVGAVNNSWQESSSEMRALLMSAGFEVEALLGDFQGTLATEESLTNIWIARRPM